MLSTKRRHILYGEFHRRYPVTLSPGDCVTHIVLHKPDGDLDANLDDLKRLCEEAQLDSPQAEILQYFNTSNSLSVKWEHHNEFVAYTFYNRAPHRKTHLQLDPISHFKNWGRHLSGELLTAVHIEIIKPSHNDKLDIAPKGLFSKVPIAGGSVCDDHARLWSDFHIYESGFSKIAVVDRDLGPHRSGRLVQRLLDVETYRILAMLGFEYSERIKNEISALELALSALKNSHETVKEEEVDKTRLYELLDLSAQTDDLQTKATPRIEATRAYARLVHQRFDDLNEERIQGAQRLSNFVRRRFAPSMNSAETTYERLKALRLRIQSEAALLRTRLDVSRQDLNTQVLQAMDRRMQLQIKLQQTVEALSVVAISYYSIGIFAVFAKAFKDDYKSLSPEHLTALAAPIIIISVCFCVRRAREKISQYSPESTSEIHALENL